MATGEDLTLSGVRRMLPNRVGLGICLAFALLFLVGGGAAIAVAGVPAARDGVALLRLVVMPIVFSLIGAYWFGRVGKKPSKEAQELRSTAEGVELGGERIVAREDVRSALVWPTKVGGTVVRVERRGVLRGPVDVQVQSLEEGRALVRSLGHGGAQAARRFRIAAPSYLNYRRRISMMWGGLAASVLALILAGNLLAAPAMAVLGPLFALVFVGLLGQLMKGAHVEVGADGVHVSWLWQRSFIPMSEIVGAESVEGEVALGNVYPISIRIHRRGGPPVDLLAQLGRAYYGQGEKWKHLATMRADVVVERINEAVAERSQGGSAGLATWESELLSRGERAIQPWVAALRALHSDVESFRKQAGGGIEALWGVLEDAAAEPQRRAAAAVALTPHLDDGGRERVRIAARATAAPKLRIALEAAADDDEDALVAALDEVSETSPPEVARADS